MTMTTTGYVKLVAVVTHAKSLAPLRAETSKNNESAGIRAHLSDTHRGNFPLESHPFLSRRRAALRAATVHGVCGAARVRDTEMDNKEAKVAPNIDIR
ncbi:hypothetical protein DBV15_06596 [Temnothorax longispinosus]|uniref:Uncharacterized protein n=1 Tax=Temnothorax longispinosus TaxID=300112 RepID=A0A4S2KM34_9HYME|nr:hypothetical protein DBV15_06596 [Temnothorax longispinosus]